MTENAKAQPLGGDGMVCGGGTSGVAGGNGKKGKRGVTTTIHTGMEKECVSPMHWIKRYHARLTAAARSVNQGTGKTGQTGLEGIKSG